MECVWGQVTNAEIRTAMKGDLKIEGKKPAAVMKSSRYKKQQHIIT